MININFFKKTFLLTLLSVFSSNVFVIEQILTDDEIKDIRKALNYIVPAREEKVIDVYNSVTHKDNFEKYTAGAKNYISNRELQDEKTNIDNSFNTLKKYGLHEKTLQEIKDFIVQGHNNFKIALSVFGFENIPMRIDLEEARKRLLVRAEDDDSPYSSDEIIKNYKMILDFLDRKDKEKLRLEKEKQLKKDVLQERQALESLLSAPISQRDANKDFDEKEIKEALEMLGVNYSSDVTWDEIESAYNERVAHFKGKPGNIIQEFDEMMETLKKAKDKGLLPYQNKVNLDDKDLPRSSSYEFDELDDEVETEQNTNSNQDSQQKIVSYSDTSLKQAKLLEDAYQKLGLEYSPNTEWKDILKANLILIGSKNKTPEEKKEIIKAMDAIEEAKDRNELPYQNKR